VPETTEELIMSLLGIKLLAKPLIGKLDSLRWERSSSLAQLFEQSGLHSV
jgi:hypothetical protein